MSRSVLSAELSAQAPDASLRKHFDAMLTRVQQAHLRGAVEAELRAAGPDKIWCRDNRVLLQGELGEGDVVMADAVSWSSFVRGPKAPSIDPGAWFDIPREEVM